MKTSKRPYQAECLESIVNHFYKEGITCQAVSLPTSSGKTVIVADLPTEMGMLPGESLLFLAHRYELIDQAAEKFRTYNPGLTVGVERAGERSLPDADVVVASIQSMTASRIKKFDPDRFRITCLDESHHAATSAEYQRIMEYFGVHRSRATLSRQKLLVGLSATWRRTDGKGYEHLYDKIVYHKSILDVMRMGIQVGPEWCPYLAPIRSNRELTNMSIDKVHTERGDFVVGELAKAVDTPERNNFVVDTYLDKGEDMPFLAFTVNVAHSHNMAKAFNDRGIPCEAIYGEMAKSERRSYFEDYKRGTLRGMCSCDAITEGTDLPWACVGLNAKPMLSIQKYTQGFGRIGRPFPAPEERLSAYNNGTPLPWIKPYGIWLDFTDSSTKHNLVQAPTLFGLRPDFNFRGKDIDETVAAIAEAKEKNPSLDTSALRTLDDLTRSTVSYAAMELPKEDVDLRKWSVYPWQREGEGQWSLPIKGTNTVIRIRQEDEKRFGIWGYQMGAGVRKAQDTTLAKSLKSAERLLTAKEKKILRREAPWRREAPTPGQCWSLWLKDSGIRREHKTKELYYEYCKRRYDAGEMEFSKGSIGDMVAVHHVANKFFGHGGGQKKSNWVQKRMEAKR